jgi:hypothetical protein
VKAVIISTSVDIGFQAYPEEYSNSQWNRQATGDEFKLEMDYSGYQDFQTKDIKQEEMKEGDQEQQLPPVDVGQSVS